MAHPRSDLAKMYPGLTALGIEITDIEGWTNVVHRDEWKRACEEVSGLNAHIERTGPHLHTGPQFGIYAYDAEDMVCGFNPNPPSA